MACVDRGRCVSVLAVQGAAMRVSPLGVIEMPGGAGLRSPWLNYNIDPNFDDSTELCSGDPSCLMSGKLPSNNFSNWMVNNSGTLLTIGVIVALAFAGRSR